jgi:hypothetical protein
VINCKSVLLKIFISIAILFVAADAVYSEDSLKTENMLHPLDSFTASTFNRGEWSYNQPVSPYPGWFWWGITNWLTAELDIPCWIGGVASFNFRIGSIKQSGILPMIAFETMYQYLPKEINLLEDYNYMNIKRKGHSWYNRANFSWNLFKSFYIHASAGATYSENLLIENKKRSVYHGKEYTDLISPDYSLAIDWRIFNLMSFHTSASYGVTFVYIDNVPRKYQLTSGFRFAPFIYSKFGILRTLRIEAMFIAFRFKEAREYIASPFGYFYWQWGGGN